MKRVNLGSGGLPEFLRDNADAWLNVINTAQSALLIVDQHGVVQFCSTRAQDLLNLNDLQNNQSNISQIFYSTTPAYSLEERLQLAAESRKTYTCKAKAPGQGKTIYDLSIAPLMAEGANSKGGDRLVGFSISFHENSLNTQKMRDLAAENAVLKAQLNRVTDQLEQSEARFKHDVSSQNQFVANISHEIRTPLNAMMGMIYLLNRQLHNKDDLELISKIDSASKTLLRSVNDILDFAKIDANQMTIESVPFQLSSVIENVASVVGALQVNKELQVNVDPVPEQAEHLIGDPLRVGQVLINIAANAIKFTEHGEINIGIRHMVKANDERVWLRFTITDTGIGIAEHRLQQIFEIPNQLEDSFTRAYGGIGLGLHISRSLAELMGGDIKVYSRIGEGTEFYIELPFELGPKPEQLTGVKPHKSIIVADDHPGSLNSMTRNIVSLGWSCKPVSNYHELLDLLERADLGQCDVLLLSYGFCGVETKQMLAMVHSRINQPPPFLVLVVSPHDRNRIIDEIEQTDIYHLIMKPVTSSSIYNTVMELSNEQQKHIKQVAKADTFLERLKNISILVVDDSVFNREVAQSILEAEGAQVITVEDGEQAIATLTGSDFCFDLVLMDVQMPNMDGYATTAKIRKFPQFASLPIVALTAGAFESDKQAAYDAGMDCFLAKPFDVEQLVDKVVELKQRRLETQPVPSQQPFLEASKLDDLALMNTHQAIKKWNSEESYCRQLRLFSKLHSEDLPLIKHHVIANFEYAKQILFKLKGAASALSLDSLYRYIDEIEHQVKTKQDLDVESLVGVEMCFDRTMSAIFDYLIERDEFTSCDITAQPQADNKQKAEKTSSENQSDESYRQLLEALENQDEQQVAVLLDKLQHRLPIVVQRKIRQCSQPEDFEKIKSILVTEQTHDFKGSN